jgi:hypothetical protein
MRVFLLLLFFVLMAASCTDKAAITGHWRPKHLVGANKDKNYTAAIFGDLLLQVDSSFVSKGLEELPIKTEGWHNGDTQKGKWGFFKDTLSLWIEGTSFPLKLKVLKLTKEEMDLEGPFLGGEKVTLIRVKDVG